MKRKIVKIVLSRPEKAEKVAICSQAVTDD